MKAALLALMLSGVVDLNQATPEELRGLPGIGPKKVEAIIQFRSQHPFRRATEIMRIRGIGPKLYQRLKDSVCAGSACAPPADASQRERSQ